MVVLPSEEIMYYSKITSDQSHVERKFHRMKLENNDCKIFSIYEPENVRKLAYTQREIPNSFCYLSERLLIISSKKSLKVWDYTENVNEIYGKCIFSLNFPYGYTNDPRNVVYVGNNVIVYAHENEIKVCDYMKQEIFKKIVIERKNKRHYIKQIDVISNTDLVAVLFWQYIYVFNVYTGELITKLKIFREDYFAPVNFLLCKGNTLFLLKDKLVELWNWDEEKKEFFKRCDVLCEADSVINYPSYNSRYNVNDEKFVLLKSESDMGSMYEFEGFGERDDGGNSVITLFTSRGRIIQRVNVDKILSNVNVLENRKYIANCKDLIDRFVFIMEKLSDFNISTIDDHKQEGIKYLLFLDSENSEIKKNMKVDKDIEFGDNYFFFRVLFGYEDSLKEFESKIVELYYMFEFLKMNDNYLYILCREVENIFNVELLSELLKKSVNLFEDHKTVEEFATFLKKESKITEKSVKSKLTMCLLSTIKIRYLNDNPGENFFENILSKVMLDGLVDKLPVVSIKTLFKNTKEEKFRNLFDSNVKKLFKTREHSNLVLKTKGEKVFKVHKEVLLIKSNFFHLLLKFPTKSKSIKIEDLSEVELEKLIEFFYVNTIKSNRLSMLFKLLKFSEMYLEVELKFYLLNKIRKIIKSFSSKQLKEEALSVKREFDNLPQELQSYILENMNFKVALKVLKPVKLNRRKNISEFGGRKKKELMPKMHNFGNLPKIRNVPRKYQSPVKNDIDEEFSKFEFKMNQKKLKF